MIAVFLAPFYLGACAYIIVRLFKSLGYCHNAFKNVAFRIPVTVIYSFFVLSPLIAFFLPTGTQIRRVIQLIGSYWFGIILYAFLTVTIAHLVSVLLRRVFKVIPRDFFRKRGKNIVCLILSFAFIGAVSVYGAVNARNIKINDYSVTVNKQVEGMDSLNVVLIADLHMGYSIGVDHIKKMVEKVNSQNPDIICIAGDIYDNDFDAFEDPDALAEELSKLSSKYGTYACWGNHDVNQKILGGFTFDNIPVIEHDQRMDEFFKKSKINLLADETVLIDNKFYVSGRVDGEKPATENNVRKSPEELLEGIDKSKPVFMIYHEPDELSEISEAGIDLLLCGHTHDGQLFPANIITAIKWENSFGYLKKGDMHNIVTSGVGVWGPFMRVGTDSEICSIKVKFE
ncbi:MAG: metallophosphoesterase [Ruminococcus sp.]|nr:metallophosphoesterase [Ruminococcus sp.]